MAKSPENMTAEERLKRIRSLERKVATVENERYWAERESESVRHWAEEAWKEVRRLHDVCSRHWEEKEQIRVAAGLPRESADDPARTLGPRNPSVGGRHMTAEPRGHKVTIYRDDSTVQVVYERVKSVFWTAANTVLVIARWDAETGDGHHYIHWPRERFCWFKEEHRGA